MADSRVRLEVEDWIRREWLPARFAKLFSKERVSLSSGGLFEFGAVSEEHQIITTISTSRATTAGGKNASGNFNKLRSDMYFLRLAPAERRIVVPTEEDMFEWCEKQREDGRVPTSIEFHLADIPDELRRKLQGSRGAASREVSPQ